MPVPSSSPLFVEIPGNPVPLTLSGGHFEAGRGKRLRYAVAKSRLAVTRGTVVLLQGRNEAIEKYFETIGDLNKRGFAVAIFDWRGQGGSDRLGRNPRKGHIDRIETYVDDLETFLRQVVLPDCRGPYAMLAHSLGALVALTAIPRLVNRIERLVVLSPFVALPDGAPGGAWLGAGTTLLHRLGLGGTTVRRIRPRTGPDALDDDPLTSDPARFERNRRLAEAAPQLFVREMTASWLRACLTAMRRLEDSDVVAGLHLPTLFLTAGEDRVVSSAAAERLAWRMRSGHVISIPGARHELLQESARFREPTLAAFESFVAGALPLRSEAPPRPAAPPPAGGALALSR